MDRDEFLRPSTWVAATGVGVAVAGGVLLADLTAGRLRDFAIYPVLALTGWGLVLALAHGGTGLLGFALLVWDAVTVRRPDQAVGGGDDTLPPELIPVAADPTDIAVASAWKLALTRFFRAGDAAGSFSIRALSDVVSDGDWGLLTDFYCSDAGRRVLRDRGGNLGTAWGYGWSLDGALQALGTGKLPLPDMPVPDVQPFVAHATQRNTKRRSSAVVEGEKRGN